MITIPSEYLNANWKTLIDNQVLHILLSEWDEGDAYSLSSIGVFPSSKEVYGVIVIGEKKFDEYPVVVQLIEVTGNNVDYIAPTGKKYMAKSYLYKNGTEKHNVVTNIVNIGQELSLRHHGIIETDLLKNKSVLIFGLGTGGMQIATNLAKSGVGHFHLIDPDRIEIGNVCRHQAGLSNIGRRKVFVAKDLLLEKNPAIKVSTYPMSANESSRSELQEIAKKSDLIVCATDNRESKLLINSIGVQEKKAIFFSGAFRRAYGGHILRVYPGQSACYHCFLLGMPEVEIDQEISSDINASDIAYSDRPVPIEPGLAIDVEPIGTMTSKLVLQELIKDKDSTLRILDKDFLANWYFWINRPEPETPYASWPSLSEEAKGMTILRWYGVSFSKDDACPTCGNFASTVRQQYGLEPNENLLPESSILPPDVAV